MSKLQDHVALVTGASKGLGLAIARLLAGEGCQLMLTARNADRLAASAKEIAGLGVRVVHQPGDVSDEAHVDALFATLEKEFGRLDLLVNNAGAFDGGPLDTLSVEAWDRVMATNLRGPFLCTRLAMRIMKRQQRGRIINVGSISSHRVRPRSAPYSTTKHGLWGLTQVTALEGREHGITCGILNPGNIEVERRQGSGKQEDDEPMMSTDEVAQVALLMATLPPHVEMLEATVLPHLQQYVGRG